MLTGFRQPRVLYLLDDLLRQDDRHRLLRLDYDDTVTHRGTGV